MKKAQTAVEYLIFLILTTLLCVVISMMWNRNAIINGGTFGVEDSTGAVHVRPMTE
ncbi:MAG: hypothetical protein Q4F80_04720 [bacterium]|nr:hypothetical protein [bacterium]